MRKLLLFSVILVSPLFTWAGAISDLDVATYSMTGKDGKPTGMLMRLSRLDGMWVMEGKNDSASSWENISCDIGCDYRNSSISEQHTYLDSLPNSMRNQFDIACIQNVANAFCRLTKKNDASKGGYLLISLVTGKPIPMSLKRLTKPYN